MIREVNKNDLDEILQLYLYLHEKSIPEDSEQLRNTWENIINDVNHHLIVCEIDGKIVASCVCVIIPNITRSALKIDGTIVATGCFVDNHITRVYVLPEHQKKRYHGHLCRWIKWN